MLIERGGKLATRAEIKKALWPNDTVVDFDRGINAAIVLLRRALGDSAANPHYIETLGRRGYRLLAGVEWAAPTKPLVNTQAPLPLPRETPSLGDLIGKKVSHYRVVSVLGGGGMGMVYRAEDLRLGRSVALKFLPDELASDPVAFRRLEREARTASALNHPNICTIFDIEEHAGQPFIAMELLEGETLAERIVAASPAPLPPLEVIDVAIQVCSGLQAAHEKGIVHRDIKPANIFLTRQGPAKVLDFGVAKLVGEPAHDVAHGNSPPTPPGLTRTGASVGTAAYMSPEQARKEPLDARSDLYSLGLVLHEMATGRRALREEGSSGADALTTDPGPRAVTAAPPRALGAILDTALENDPARRFQTASEMRRDLERARARVRHRGWNVRSGIAIALLVLLMASGLWLWLGRTRPAVRLAEDDTLVIAHLTNQTGDRVFDDALYSGLRIALEQTPYLNVLGEAKVGATLGSMKLGPGTRLTPEIALEVCRRSESRIMVSPSIADAGNRLRLGLSGVDCRSGARIAHVDQDAASPDAVVHSLGMAAARLRVLLGEPAESIARFNAPLERATSASPEAIELLTLGYRRHLAGNFRDAISYYERAVRIDPDFALAHAALTVAQVIEGHQAPAEVSSRRAFELRDRLTLPARFNVESTYYREVTGKDDESCTVIAQWVQTFPHDFVARNNFSQCLTVLGEPDRALGEAREAARLLPSPFSYGLWVSRALDAERVDEAKQTYDEALRRGFESPALRERRALLAFLERDDQTLREQWSWAQGKPQAEVIFNSEWALSEAFHGRLRASLHFAKTAAVLHAKAGEAAWSRDELNSALIRAEAGIRSPLPVAADAAHLNLGTRTLAALTLARTGQLDGARKAANAFHRDFPSHTLIQNYGLPVIEAAVRLESNDAAGAIEALRPTAKYELTTWGSFPELYSAYLRGLAWLRMGDGQAAAAEFQKVLAHPGLVGRWAIGAMARAQLARAQHLAGEDAAALSSYESFLDIWKDADDDLPLYKEARAEYRSLRKRIDGR